MIDAKYYKDYRHNYMILQCKQEEISRSYQYKILTSGKIKEILKCSIRHINGQTFFYYDISSKTTLGNYYQGKKMSYQQVRDLLQQLYNIYSRLGTFFMEEAKLVVLPESLYYDLGEQKYIGLYYPDYEPNTANSYEALMDFLLDHIDTQDQQLADCMYRIYEMSEEAGFSIEDALYLLDQHNTKEGNMAGEPDLFSIPKDPETEKAESAFYACEPEPIPKRQSSGKKKSLFYPVFAVLSAGGIAAAMTIYYLYELSSEETLILIGCVASMGVCLLICLAAMLRERRKENQGKKQEYRSSPEQKPYDLYETVKAPVSLEHVLSRDMDLSMADQRPNHAEAPYYGHSCSNSSYEDISYNNKKPPYEKSSCEDVKYGNTVFFDLSKMAEYKLYALDKQNKNHIELKQFPCTVGKMAGCVDYVLSDESVSRIYAKFDKKDDKILLTDMNSTNGTYKNGLRMQPQETTEIEPGDEIRFGNLNYCYR